MIGDSHRTPALPCPGCGKGLDGHMEASPNGPKPEPGAASICVYCSTLSIYIEVDGQLALRRATDTELDCLLSNPAVQRAIGITRTFRERQQQC